MAIPTGNLIVQLDASNSSSYSGSGNTWYDLSAEGNDFYLRNSPSLSGTGNSKYFVFNAQSASQFASRGEVFGSTYSPSNPVFTLNLWARYTAVTGVTYGCRLGQGTDGGGIIPGLWKEYSGSSDIVFEWGGGSDLVDTNFTPTVNQWYNYQVTCSGTAYTVYINGTKYAEDLSLASKIYGGPITTMNIGSLDSSGSTPVYPTNSQVALFEYYDVSLTQNQVIEVFNNQASRFIDTSDVIKYDFADTDCYPGSGNTVFNLSTSSNLFGTVTGAGFSAGTDAFVFDTTGDIISVQDVYDEIDISNNFTYIVVFNREAPLTAGDQTLFSLPYRNNWSSTPYYGLYLGYENATNNYVMYTNDSTSYIRSGIAASNIIGEWTAAAIAFSSGTAQVYINGIGVSTVTGLSASIDLSNNTELALANYASFFSNSSGQFTGQMAAFELHDEVLSGAAISSISQTYLDRYAPAPPVPPAYVGIAGGRQFSQGFNG